MQVVPNKVTGTVLGRKVGYKQVAISRLVDRIERVARPGCCEFHIP
jgi:hypothetical protein